MEHEHRNNSLYPRSAFRCSACGEIHGTRAYNGAVNWQCPRELLLDEKYHEPARQIYVGYYCIVCNEIQC
jgi:hypothetical protein